MTYTSLQFAKANLTKHQIDQFLQLQTRVRESLSVQTSHYIKERSAERIVDHLNSGMPILTLSNNEHITGSVMLTYPDNSCSQFLDGYPFSDIGEQKGIAVIQSLYVDPDYRGQGLATRLIKCAALESNRSVLVAKAAAHNEKSQKSFSRNGFNITARGKDPKKHYDVVYMQANAGDVLNTITAKELSRHAQTTLPVARDHLTM